MVQLTPVHFFELKEKLDWGRDNVLHFAVAQMLCCTLVCRVLGCQRQALNYGKLQANVSSTFYAEL